MTAPRCTRTRSPSWMWSSGTARAARVRGDQRRASRSRSAGTARPPSRAPSRRTSATRRRRTAPGAAARPEAGDGGGDGGVVEGHGGRLDDVDRLAAEAVQQQLAHEAPVVGVEPLRRGDEGAPVARPRPRRGGEEEVHVQAGQAAGLQAVGPRREGEPLLPAGRDLVVADVGRVAEVERRRRRRGGVGRGRAVVGHLDPRAGGEPGGGQVAAAGRGREGVELHRQEAGRAEAAPRRDREAARARAGVDHPGGRALARGPGHHRLDDGGRRVGGAVAAPLLGRAQPAERLAQGVGPLGDPAAQPAQQPRRRRAGGRARGRGRSRRGTTRARPGRPARGRPRGAPGAEASGCRRDPAPPRARSYGGRRTPRGRARGHRLRAPAGRRAPPCAGDDHRAAAPASRTGAARAAAAA